MENFKIGQKVFMIRSFRLEEVEIKSISIQENKTLYKVKGGYDSCEAKDLFKTRLSAQTELDVRINKLKFHIGDVVIGKLRNGYGNEHTVIGKIVEIYCGKNNEVEYQIGNIEGTGYFSRDRGTADKLVKVKEKYIREFGKLRELIGDLKELEIKAREIKSEINDIYRQLDKELLTSYGKYTSYFNFDKNKYSDRFYIEGECDDD